jgi:hypothetical protein
MMRLLPLVALIACATPALARDPLLGLPIACTLGDECFIQHHVDADPGPGGADFTCGPLSYDGHTGTDFALTSLAAMLAGVDVIAAAPGVVRALRDGMPDLGLAGTPADTLDGQECGNGVVIDHGDGWSTQYCHMREGSIAVRVGERVAMGKVLGLVGLSGKTEFAHLHFTVRDEGRVIDPFNTDEITDCGRDDGPGDDLWKDPLPYVPGGLIAVGIADAVPGYDAIKAGDATRDTLPGDAPALVGWAYLFGGRAGDVVAITLSAPDGSALLAQEVTLEKTQAQLFRAAGKKRGAAGWAAGDWRITAELRRDGAVVDTLSGGVRVGD